MAKYLLKSGTLIVLMVGLALWAPMVSAAGNSANDPNQGSNSPSGPNLPSTPGEFNGFVGQATGLFGGMGAAGSVIGEVLGLLVSQALNITSTENPAIPGLFVLNASNTTTISTQIPLSGGQNGTYYPNYNYFNTSVAQIATDHGVNANQVGYPYCVVSRNGSGYISVNVTVGMSVTVLIWDQDHSLISAISKVISAVQGLKKAQDTAVAAGETQDQINADPAVKTATQNAVSTVLYLLIHINDIITGDELIVVNPITFTTVSANATFGETHTWYVPIWPNGQGQPTNYLMNQSDPLVLQQWGNKAQTDQDQFMHFLVNGSVPYANHNASWGSFSFDLLQIWLKRLYVSIDVSALMNLVSNNGQTGTGQTANPADILKNMDIEFYVIWHHLVGAVLYNTTTDNMIDVNYATVTYGNGTTVLDPNGQPVQRPNATNVEYLIGLRNVQSADWLQPTVSTSANGTSSLSWGVTFENPSIIWVPPGVDPQSYVMANNASATLTYISLGFTFTPGTKYNIIDQNGNPTGVIGQQGQVKLNQAFGAWDNKSAIPNLGLAVVYVSAILHVHFTGALPSKASADASAWNQANENIAPNQTQVTTQNSFTFGTAAGAQIAGNP